jgi:hypothetical protein
MSLMRPLLIAGTVALVACTFGRPACAALEYKFHFGSSSYTVAPGESAEVQLFLTETYDNAELDMPRLDTEGFTSIGGLISSGSPGVQSAALPTLAVNPAFDQDLSSLPSSTQALLSGVALVNPPPKANQLSPNSYTILVGTATFKGVTAGTVTTLTAVDPGPASVEDTVLEDGTVLDALITNATAQFTVTGDGQEVIPEPGSLALVCVAGVLVAARRFRKRRCRQRPSGTCIA